MVFYTPPQKKYPIYVSAEWSSLVLSNHRFCLPYTWTEISYHIPILPFSKWKISHHFPIQMTPTILQSYYFQRPKWTYHFPTRRFPTILQMENLRIQIFLNDLKNISIKNWTNLIKSEGSLWFFVRNLVIFWGPKIPYVLYRNPDRGRKVPLRHRP